jgi:type IV pilus assembly protein PilO
MELSLTKLPWYGQIGAFVLVCAGAVFGFWNFYVSEVATDIAMRQTHLRALRADINKGVATARRLPEFQAQVTDLERRLESLRAVLPEQKDVADTLRRLQGLATQSNLTILRFTPAAQKQQPLYAEVPYRISAEGTYHNLGLFFDRVSKFPRIINVGDIAIRAAPQPTATSTITADCTATTFVLQEAAPKGGRGVPPPVAR